MSIDSVFLTLKRRHNNNNNNSKFIGQIATYEIIKLLQIA